MKPIKMRRLDFPLPRVGDFFQQASGILRIFLKESLCKDGDCGPQGEAWRPNIYKIKLIRLSPIRRAEREAHEHYQDSL